MRMDDQLFSVLMGRVQAGDRDAIGTLLVAGFDATRAAVARCMDDVLARGHLEPEDIVQEAFAAAWPKMPEMRFNGFEAFQAWLRTVAENKVIDVRRALLADKRDIRREVNRAVGQSRSYADLLNGLMVAGSTPTRQVARKEAIAVLMVQMAQLPQDYRQVIQLRIIQGLPASEIAGLLGRSEDAVYMLCYRALKKLGEMMGPSSNYLSDS
jgi:RNA polymerase sigma-70 factor, ECF subfamily